MPKPGQPCPINKTEQAGNTHTAGPLNAASQQPKTATTGLEFSALAAIWNKAHREARGSGMPAAWKAVLEGELKQGNGEVLATVDAQSIRDAEQLAKQKQRTFGIGWVLQVLRKRIAAELAEQQRQEAEAERQQREQSKQQADEAHRREVLDLFAGLDPEQQAPYRQRARQLLLLRPDATAEDVQRAAARLWEKDRGRQDCAEGAS